MLDIPENAVSLAEYKRKNLLNKDKLNQEVHVDTSKNTASNVNRNNKKEKTLKVNNKRDNRVEENLNELISKKIIQSTNQREEYGYENNRNREEFGAGKDRKRNDFNGERRDYNAAENSNKDYYNNRNYENKNNNNNDSNNYNRSYNNYNKNYGEKNQEEFIGQYSRDNYGSHTGRGGNYNSNRNPLRNVIFIILILMFNI